MSSIDQARADLTAATNAHEASLEALRTAKVAFFDSASDKDRKLVVSSEDAVRAAALLLERAEHIFQTAQRQAVAETLAGQRERLSELNAATLARTARSSELLTALVDIERQAFGLINELEELLTKQANEFQERKSLALATGEPTPMRPGKNATDFRYQLQAEIKAAQIREGRDGYSNGQVSTWLQPSAFATSNKLLTKEASSA